MRSLYHIAIVLFVCLRDSPEAQCVDPDQSCINCLCEEWSDCRLYINSSSTVVTNVCADRTCNELPCLRSLLPWPIAVKCGDWAANICCQANLPPEYDCKSETQLDCHTVSNNFDLNPSVIDVEPIDILDTDHDGRVRILVHWEHSPIDSHLSETLNYFLAVKEFEGDQNLFIPTLHVVNRSNVTLWLMPSQSYIIKVKTHHDGGCIQLPRESSDTSVTFSIPDLIVSKTVTIQTTLEITSTVESQLTSISPTTTAIRFSGGNSASAGTKVPSSSIYTHTTHSLTTNPSINSTIGASSQSPSIPPDEVSSITTGLVLATLSVGLASSQSPSIIPPDEVSSITTGLVLATLSASSQSPSTIPPDEISSITTGLVLAALSVGLAIVVITVASITTVWLRRHKYITYAMPNELLSSIKTSSSKQVLLIYSHKTTGIELKVILQCLVSDLSSYEGISVKHPFGDGRITNWSEWIENEANKADTILCVCDKNFQQDWLHGEASSSPVVCFRRLHQFCHDRVAVALLRESDRVHIPSTYLKERRTFLVNAGTSALESFILERPEFEVRCTS